MKPPTPPVTITINGFPGGVNQRLPAMDIADDELVDALNIELGKDTALRTRPGVTNRSGGSPPFTGSVTSLYHYRKSSGTEYMVATDVAGLYKCTVGGTTWTSIEGSLGLSSTYHWEWGVLDDLLIGTNGTDALVKWNGTGDAAALGGSPPAVARHMAIMDNRLFFVDNTAPNTLRWCALGDPEDWTTTGPTGAGSWEVGGAEGDAITALFPHRGRLFIFKTRNIYTLVPGAPREDTDQWAIPLFTSGVGCVSAQSIQVLMDDLVFLSDAGLISLAATEQYGDWKQGRLSEQIPALETWVRGYAEKVRSVVHPENMQYMIAIPTEGSTENSETWVLDFSRQRAAWTRFDGLMAGRAFGVMKEADGRSRIYVGGDAKVYRYGDANTWQDAGTNYNKRVLTKAYSFDEPMRRKIFYRFGVQFTPLTDPLTVEIQYRLDEDDGKAKNASYQFSGLLTGAKWDVAKWDQGYWSTELSEVTDLMYRIQGGPGRRAQSFDLRLWNSAAEAFVVKRLAFEVTLLDTHRRVGE